MQIKQPLVYRLAALTYGGACYLVFLATFLYAIGFIGNVFVPKSIDSGLTEPLLKALIVDVGLLVVFAIQHSVMARAWFKRVWTRVVPEVVERSTYVLLSSLALLLMFWQWRPIGGVIWNVKSAAGQLLLFGVFWAGWVTVLWSTCLINHFDLFGLRQVYLYFRNRPYISLGFRTPTLYNYVRHPLYLGWLMVFWGTPVMTVAHLVFALATTAYVFVAIQLEERDLVKVHGDDYLEYRRRIPMILPLKWNRSKEDVPLRS
jgi:methanethiol S-methyltransferase